MPSFNPSFDKLFAFGIDPVGGGLPADERSDWPGREEIEKYNRRLRRELDEAIEHALTRPWEGHPQLVEMLEVAVEQPLMKAETAADKPHSPSPGQKNTRTEKPEGQTP